MDQGFRQPSRRTGLLGSASLAAVLALLAPAAALAQGAAADEPATADIVVTGTRVIRDGYQAPTPTSVLGAQEIAAKAPTNLADYVNTLPSLQGSSTPRNTVTQTGAGTGGINALSLRNLGPNRTLVLLDGQRIAPSTLTGFVDINQLPQALVKRVDVVTGGASADWGSDAVAGVVNFVLDKDYSGLKGEAQGGVTTYGDNRSYKLSLTAGSDFAGDRGHILLSGELAHNDGVKLLGKRDWYNGAKLFFNPAYTATNGQPQLLVRPGSGFATATPGGIITAGPLQGTYFGPGGVPTQFNYGPIVSAPYMQGGDWQYADFAETGDIEPRMSRQNLFGRASFDVSDDVEIFGQLSYARARSSLNSGDEYKFGNLTIRADNAFLPASVAARMASLGLASFTMGSLNQDLGGKRIKTQRTSLRGVIGADGKFDALGSNWTWNVYGQRGVNNSDVYNTVSITANYNAAIDAVRNANGVIVCRSTLTNPTNGCVPYNIFGTGVASQAAIDWVKGTSTGHTHLTENVLAGTLHGDPFDTWAGPVSVALGAEYRREAVSGSSDALSKVNAYFSGNYKPSFGSYNVKEAFVEAVVPLAKDMAFAKSLEFNGAVRGTKYSTSGYVTTWKAGLTYTPIDDVTFRVTRSRDIRAANLAELFQAGATTTNNIADPFRGNAITTLLATTQGNLSLKPEKADTLGLGAVFKPRFLPGFTASADYYDIKIKGAIFTVDAATLVNQCFAGNTAFCGQITRNAAGVITAVVVQPVNLAQQTNRGIDFEASYRSNLEDLSSSLKGNLTLRALATRYIKNITDNGINLPINTVGTNSPNGAANLSLPRWSYAFSAGWDNGPFALNLTARGFSAGVYNKSYVECTSGCPVSTTNHMTIENNRLPGAIYFDANVKYAFAGGQELFLSVDNIANRDPAQVANGPSINGTPLSVNPTLYDLLGRTFRAGVRFKM